MFTPMKKKINRVLKTKSSRIILILSLIFLILNTTYEIRSTTIRPPSDTFYFMPQSETLLHSFSLYYSNRTSTFDFEKCNHWGVRGYQWKTPTIYKDVHFCDKQVYPENVNMDICFAYNQKKIPDDYACTFAKTKKSRFDIFRSKVDKDYREYYFDITISFFRVIIFTILPFLVFFIIRKIVLWVSRGT